MYYIISIIIMSFVFQGCEQEDDWPPCEEEQDNYELIPIYIDSNCNLELVNNQINKFNDFTSSVLCQPLVEVIGSIDVNHDSFELPKNTIACYNYEPEWYQDTKMTKYIGYSVHYKNIRLFNFKILSNKQLKPLILHELFHYVGVYGHTKDHDDIMFHLVPIRGTYSNNDKEHFCSDDSYECVN